jgi:hypothetical protein
MNQLPEIKAPEAPGSPVEFSNYLPDYLVPSYYRQLDATNYFPGFATSRKRGYVDFGAGSRLDADADAGYQVLHSDADRLSLFGSHRSSRTAVARLPQKMKINDNIAGVDYRHRFESLQLFAGAQYTRSAFNYYGLLLWDTPAAYPFIPTENQTDNLFRVHTGIESAANEAVAYKVNLAYTRFHQKRGEIAEMPGRTENRIRADFDLFARFIGVAGAVKHYAYSRTGHPFYDALSGDPAKTFGRSGYTTLSFNPYLAFGDEERSARLGIRADLQAGGVKTFRLAPDIRLRWHTSSAVLFYLSAKGGIRDNSLYESYYENRYLSPAYRLYDSKTPFDGTVGVRVQPAPDFGMDLFTGYQWVRDEHFFLNTQVLQGMVENTFAPLTQAIVPQYAHARAFKLGGEFSYAYQDLLHFGLKWAYRKWHVSRLSGVVPQEAPACRLEAWQKPAFTADLAAGLKIPLIPFRVHAAYHLETGRKALSGNTAVRMKNIHDLSLKGTYSLSDAFSFFVKLDNLCFQDYDLWYGYPARKFSLMGGINFKF